MKIEFKTLDISFSADVTDADDELIFNSLSGNGNDAMWLLESDLLDRIEMAALDEYQRIVKSSNDDMAIDNYITDQEWRLGGAI